MFLLLLIPTALLLTLLTPHEAVAWGPGIHLQLGSAVINSLGLINPSIAAVIAEFPNDFLYGCIAADITVGKKYTHYLLHCHRWSVGLKVLERAESPSHQACAYGYLAHLAADTVAHNYFIPYKIIQTFSTLTLKHAYWEMRFESFVEKDIWDAGHQVSRENYHANDTLLRSVLSDTIFSFGTNKRIFNSILLVSRLEKWQQMIKTFSDVSRYVLEETDREEYMTLTLAAVFDTLNRMEESPYFQADPTGERALLSAETVRKNLRHLYRNGKIDKARALVQLKELKGSLREAICEPDQLDQILSS